MRGDQLVERAATWLQEIADRAAVEGGIAAQLAQPLADDAAFLRKLKPSLIAARMKDGAPAAESPAPGTVAQPQRGKRSGTGGPNPFLLIGAAIVVGILAAKIIDWRSNVHAPE